MRSLLFALTLSAGLLACSGNDDSKPANRALPLPECPELDTSPCDTRAEACQQRLLRLAACVYGVDRAPDVPIRVVSEAQLLAELQEAAATDDDAAAAREAANLPHIERALVDLQLLEPGALTEGGGATAELIDRADGIYQGAEYGIALVDRGTPKDDDETAAVLVHEFVHAIQDDLYDLGTWQQQHSLDVDSMLASRSVTEGQATYAQFRVLYAMAGYDLAGASLTPALDDFRERIFATAYDDASPYLASFATFPYAAGVGPAEQAWSESGLHFAERQFSDPPLTSLAALADSYGIDVSTKPPADLLAPTLPDGFTLIDDTRLGAFVLELFLHRHGLLVSASRRRALDWRTDRLWVYAGPEESTAFLWEIELQQASAADLEGGPLSDVIHESAGPRVFFASGDAPEFLLSAGRAFLEAQR